MAMTDYETNSLLLLSSIAQGIGLQLVALNPQLRNGWPEEFTEEVNDWAKNHLALFRLIRKNADKDGIEDTETDQG